MPVSVKNLLSIELLKGSEVVAGKKGLDNIVGRINFVDCPMPENIYISDLIKKGDFFINSFYIAKGDEDNLFQFFDAYIKCECSGTLIITEYIKKLPDKIIDLCDENNFPVIFINPDIPYAEIIKSAMEMILIDQSEHILDMKIDKILEDNVGRKLITSTAHELNINFKSYFNSFYVKFNEITGQKKQMVISQIKNTANLEVLKYKNGILIIANYDRLSMLNTYLVQIESILNNLHDFYYIGISNTFEEIVEFNVCIKQSLLACEISNISNSKIIYYKDINLYKILYPLKDTDILEDFYMDIINPLIGAESSDDKYELVKTVEAYINCDGDFKKTSYILNQHENTIRYRINKAKRILNLENDNFKFVEHISIALKIKNILKL